MKLKACGLRTGDEVRAAIDLGYDYLGFVLEPGRRRSLSLLQASALAQLAQHYSQGQVGSVAVAIDLRAEWQPQLDRDPLEAFSLLQFYRYHSWPWPQNKRLRVVAARQECVGARLYLFDQSQGSGEWQEPPSWLEGMPVLYAGGVTAARLAQLRPRNLYGVDLSSGLELGGRKHYALMKQCMEALR